MRRIVPIALKITRLCLLSMVFLLFHTPSSICAEPPAISLSDAILKALEANPGVRVQEEKIKQSEGLLQTASGQFDWVTYTALSIEEKNLPLNEQDLEPAFLNQAKAKLFSNQVDLSEGEMSLYKSRQALAMDMGYTPEELAIVPNPSGTFPRVIDIGRFEIEDAEKHIYEAMKRREDYLAAQTNIEKGKILLNKARNDAKPRLDLGLKMGYAGIDESPDEKRYYQSFSNNLTGLNTYAILMLELPILNTAARGNILYRRSLLREAELALSNLSNRIASEVLVTLRALRSSINEYRLAAKSESAYKKAVEFENQKHKTGTSTLSDRLCENSLNY